MNWKVLKNTVYYEDGSLRDIYIQNITISDWKLWIDFVNSNYPVDFEVGGKIKGNKIEFELVKEHWQNPEQEYLSASIHLEKILVKTYFFIEGEIENDITPMDIQSYNDHESLLMYLKKISNCLGKPTILTQENYTNDKDILMIVDGENVRFPL